MASAGRGTGKRGLSPQDPPSVKESKTIISGLSPVELNKLFIEQQQLYNEYVPLTIDCHGPLLQLTTYYDCFKVFQGPKVVKLKRHEQDSLNITGHFQFHSGLIVKKMQKEEVTTDRKVNGIHVTLDDYVDFLEPFRRSSNLKIRGDEAGWKIDDDQRVTPPSGLLSFFDRGTKDPNLLRTDGLVNIVKSEQGQTLRSQVPFDELLSDNIDVFDSFQNKVNIVTGHNLSPALIDEHSLLFIHSLLTKQYGGDRNTRLGKIVAKLNRTHELLVEFTVKQILEDIAQFGTVLDYIPEHLKQTDPKDRIPERLFAISVAQLSSRATFSMMGYRYFLSGYSCVGTTDEDKYKCDPDQEIINNKNLIELMESLAFTLTFRVDMVYKGKKYFFSLILDRNELDTILNKTLKKKGVFKQYELYKDILHDSFQGCIMGALDRFAATTKAVVTTNAAKDAIKLLWSERTFDLIQNGCASVDHCMTLGKTPMLDKLYLQFHTKESDTDVITLRTNPFDKLTNLENIISRSDLEMDPVVNVHLHFPKIVNVLKNHLSVPPGGGEIVGWSQTVNKYDENIIERLLAQSQGYDWKTTTLFGSQSLSQSLSISSDFTADSGMSQDLSPERPPVTESVVKSISSESIEQRIGDFLKSHENDSIKTTQNPIYDCEAQQDDAARDDAPRDEAQQDDAQQDDAPRVGYFTQFRTALVALVQKLFQRTSIMDGAGSLHKKPRRTKTHTRRNKKYSRKKARHYNTYVKTRIKRRRRATYKK